MGRLLEKELELENREHNLCVVVSIDDEKQYDIKHTNVYVAALDSWVSIEQFDYSSVIYTRIEKMAEILVESHIQGMDY